MASIRRISNGVMSNLSESTREMQVIGRQAGSLSQTRVGELQEGYSLFKDDASSFELLENLEEFERIEKARREGRLSGPLSENQLIAVERFIDEAYFLLPQEYKNKAAKDAVEYQRRQYAVSQIDFPEERLTEVSRELAAPESRPDFKPLPENVTIILLKAPKQQSQSAHAWFENIKSKLNNETLFDQGATSSELSNILGTLKQNEQVRIYVERNYSAVHWRTITKEETTVISEEIEQNNIYWDDYPIFENIENEIFLREKEQLVNCLFIDYEENNPGAITPDKKRNPLNFLIEEAGWYKTSEDGKVLNPEAPVLNINYSSLLKTNSQGGLVIDDFIKALKDTKILELLENTNNFYKIENNVLVTGNNTDSGSYENLIKPFIKYKIADKLYNFFLKTNPVLFNNSYNIKLEIGIFKKLEEEGLLKEAGDRNSNIRVFYIKDEEAGELVNKNKIVLNNYLEKYQISYKEIILSDGIETLPLEGIKSLLLKNSSFFYYTLNNLIMKKFKNKDFLLNYYYNYVLGTLEENINSQYGKQFSTPRNLIIKTKEEYLDIYEEAFPNEVKARFIWGDPNVELLEVFFNNESESWLNSDYHCIAYVANNNDSDKLYEISGNGNRSTALYNKIFPWQLVPTEFSITHDNYNENYHFTFYGLLSELFHEHIHVMQTIGPNSYLRNRTFDDKEVLFEDEDSLEREFLLSKDLASLDLRQKFFYLARYVFESLQYEYPGSYLTNPDYNGFTSIASYDQAIELYDSNPATLIDEVNKNDFINNLSKELYFFYSRFKGFMFAKGSSYIGRFLENLFKNKNVNFGYLKFMVEGLAVLLTRDAFAGKYPILNNEEFKKAKHFYFLSSSSLYRSYLDVMDTFVSKIEELNSGSGGSSLTSVLDIFEDITLDNYVKDDYFKKEEHIEESFRVKEIFYSYEETPDYKKVFEKNDRFNKFTEEVERNLSYNDNRNSYRLRYRSVSPTPAVQETARPAVSPRREEPRRAEPLVTPEEAARQRAVIEQSRRQGAQLQNSIRDSSNMQNQIGQETSDAVNTQYR